MQYSEISATAAAIVAAAQKGVLKKAVFSKPCDKSIFKAVAVPLFIGGSLCLQTEFFHTDNKVTHKNTEINADCAVALEEQLSGFMQVNVLTMLGDCEYRVTAKGKRLLLGTEKLLGRLSSADVAAGATGVGNDREKQYILDGSEPFLIRLGVSAENGRVYDKKQAKFRQINRFLELIRDVENKLPSEELRICDLCCGKSYLSFAVYHYFANVKKHKVRMTGVDLKADVIEYCNRVARDVGFDGLKFICGDIREYVTEYPPSLVVSLHACDVATDVVLEKAVAWGTDVILSTPCCHHELNHSINCPTLSFITDYSMLRQKLCDAATDALRLKRLEAHGYTTAALELIDPDETPKNIMLRAVKRKNWSTDSPAARKAEEEYLAAKRFLVGEASKELHF